MKARFLALTVAAIAVGVVAVPKASACGSCLRESSVITSPAFIDTTVSAPVLVQPQMIETTPIMTQPVYSDVFVRRGHLLNLDTPVGGVHLF